MQGKTKTVLHKLKNSVDKALRNYIASGIGLISDFN